MQEDQLVREENSSLVQEEAEPGPSRAPQEVLRSQVCLSTSG